MYFTDSAAAPLVRYTCAPPSYRKDRVAVDLLRNVSRLPAPSPYIYEFTLTCSYNCSAHISPPNPQSPDRSRTGVYSRLNLASWLPGHHIPRKCPVLARLDCRQ